MAEARMSRTTVDEALVGGADDRVVADSGKSGHVQDVADGGSSAADFDADFHGERFR
jgi:hypothetical protein